MGNLVRITKDGLLSIAGMLSEDPTLDRARIDPMGNLYVRMLVEDPALAKVEWGRDGVIRCRAFWEGNGESGLWTPPPPPPPWYIYMSYGGDSNKLYRIKPDLTLESTISNSNLATIYALTGDTSYLYCFPSTYTKFAKINRGTLAIESLINASDSPIRDVLLDGENLVGVVGDTNIGKIVVYNKSGQRTYNGSNILTPFAQRIYKYNDKVYVVSGSPSYIVNMKIYELDLNWQILRSVTISTSEYFADAILAGDLYILTQYNGSGAYNRLHRINLSTMTLIKTVRCPDSYGPWWTLVYLSPYIYVGSGGFFTGLYANIYKYSLNLDYIGKTPIGNANEFHLRKMVTDNIYIYIYALGENTQKVEILKINPANMALIARKILSSLNYTNFCFKAF